MPIIGITGGIASGKSTFRQLLLDRVAAGSFDADACARQLLEKDDTIRAQIVAQVHPEAYLEDGTPNRPLLRDLIYRDDAKKRALEAILHPVIRDSWSQQAREARAAGHLFLVDIPLLFETGAESEFDHIVTVGCTVETQLARLTRRSGLTREISEKIIGSQMPLGHKISRSHHVIWNEGTLETLTAQTDLFSHYLHARYG